MSLSLIELINIVLGHAIFYIIIVPILLNIFNIIQLKVNINFDDFTYL